MRDKGLQKNPHFQIKGYICKNNIMAQTLPSKGLGTPLGPSFPTPGSVMALIGEKKKEEERFKQRRQDIKDQQFYQESVNAYDYGNQKVHVNDRSYLDQRAASSIDPIKKGIREGKTRVQLQGYEEALHGTVQDNRQAESQFTQMNELAKGLQDLEYVNQGVLSRKYKEFFDTAIGQRDIKSITQDGEMYDAVKMAEMTVRDTLVEQDAKIETIGGVQVTTQVTASPLYVLDPATGRVAFSDVDGKPMPTLNDPMAFYAEMLRKNPHAQVVFDHELKKARELNPERRIDMIDIVRNVMGRMYDRFPTAVTSTDVRTKAAPGRRAAPAAEKKAAEKVKLFDKKATQLDAVLAGDKAALTSLKTDVDPSKFKIEYGTGNTITISKWVRPERQAPLWEVEETFDRNTDRERFKLAVYGYFGTKARNTYAGLPEHIRGTQPAGEVDLGY